MKHEIILACFRESVNLKREIEGIIGGIMEKVRKWSG